MRVMTLEERERRSRAQKERYSKPEEREKSSKASKEAWSIPGFREKQSKNQREAYARPEVKQKISKIHKEAWARPGAKEQRSKIAKITWKNPELRIRQSKILKGAKNRPEVKERQSRTAKEVMARPEVKERQSRAAKERYSKLEEREKLSKAASGSKNPHWKGGKSFEPYCPKFTKQLKEEIRTAFNHHCFLCPAEQNGKKLDIHHIDYDKNDLCNGKKWPLLPFCHSCHMKTNFNRWYWFNLLLNYWAMDPEINLQVSPGEAWKSCLQAPNSLKALG